MKVINTYLRTEYSQGIDAALLFVLAKTPSGRYAVYRGIVAASTPRSKRDIEASWVMARGNKCSEQEARSAFDFPEGKYNR